MSTPEIIPPPADTIAKSLEEQLRFFTEMDDDERRRRVELVDRLNRLTLEIEWIKHQIDEQTRQTKESMDL